ncbi:hypothetical protein PSA7680_02729 [Pseudoruegeria aquimaris]|uniref:DUF2948 domain-containing protein n=1 Tax=Pseudoruegeria aquimaris TaxID=393663 RepID=A0A1Y5T1Z7_9RHOB|nr:DUF2948 family protein [Pseudoruegeria aquimaris]SLN52214.1 hypothetical protein PSA7680_02729 [Pseudoruegeria aquimaris]
MQEDARFEDGGEAPLHLKALDAEDLQVLATLTQDAVFPASEMTWQPKERRFALLLNRFRWEDQPNAEKRRRPYERVQSVLAFDSVLSVQSQGVRRGDADTVLSLLSIDWTPGEDAEGFVELTLAGDGAIRLHVECLEATLKDVTRPYIAPSRAAPHHPD